MRLALRVAAGALALLALLPFHYLWTLAGRPSPWPRRFLAFVGFATGLRIRVAGTPRASHVLFVANHTSWLDIMVLAATGGAAFVSKAEVARWPVIGWLANLNRTVYVARADRKAVRGQAESVRAALRAGRPVALFPEGTTDGGVDLFPFRPALLESLYPPLPGILVQPVAIDYGAAARDIEWIGKEGAAANARRIVSRPGTADVTVDFLDPIDPAGVADRKALAQLARRNILAALAARRGASAARTDPL